MQVVCPSLFLSNPKPWNPKECKSRSLWLTNLVVMPATAFLRRLLSNLRKELAWKVWNMEILGLPVVAKKELNRGDKSLRNCRRPSNMNAKKLCFTHKICSRHGFLQGSVSKKSFFGFDANTSSLLYSRAQRCQIRNNSLIPHKGRQIAAYVLISFLIFTAWRSC